MVAYDDPFGSIIEVHVELRLSIDLAVQVSQGKMNLLRVLGGLEDQGAPAPSTEYALSVLRGLVGDQALLP